MISGPSILAYLSREAVIRGISLVISSLTMVSSKTVWIRSDSVLSGFSWRGSNTFMTLKGIPAFLGIAMAFTKVLFFMRMLGMQLDPLLPWIHLNTSGLGGLRSSKDTAALTQGETLEENGGPCAAAVT